MQVFGLPSNIGAILAGKSANVLPTKLPASCVPERPTGVRLQLWLFSQHWADRNQGSLIEKIARQSELSVFV